MSRRRKIFLVIGGIGLAMVSVMVWIACHLIYTLNQLPAAYAAWDTGTLLVEYMKGHEDRWPKSWEELLSVLGTNSERRIILRGRSNEGDLPYARSLREKVRIDWTFKPMGAEQGSPVTRMNGQAFPVVWQGAEPNEMVREYMKERASTRPSPSVDAKGAREESR